MKIAGWRFIVFATLFCLTSCISDTDTNSYEEDEVYNTTFKRVENQYKTDFPAYGFSVVAPCLLKDVSDEASGKYLVNYGGILNEYNPQKMVAYQVLVYELNLKYKNISRQEYEKNANSLLKKGFENGSVDSFELIKFGKYGFPCCKVSTHWNSYKQQTIVFVVENKFIALNVITNDNIDKRFDDFINSVEFYSEENDINDTLRVKQSTKIKMTTKKLEKHFSNEKFELDYPSDWQIIQDDNTVKNTNVSLQIMEKKRNDVDFRPNINIIISSKRDVSKQEIISWSNHCKGAISGYKELSVDNTIVGNANGWVLNYNCVVDGYLLLVNQYSVKKQNGSTVLIITSMVDQHKTKEQSDIVNSIVQSIHVK